MDEQSDEIAASSRVPPRKLATMRIENKMSIENIEI